MASLGVPSAGSMRTLSTRGRGRGRVLPATLRPPQQAPAAWTLRDEADEVHSDDSTQPPDDPWPFPAREPPCTHVEVNTTTEDIASASKRVSGVAKGTEFERLRKYGKIPLDIHDGKIGPSCNNRTVYTTRVTWVVKHHADMRHVSWSAVDEKAKEELIERVRADFVFDWMRKNHRRTVTSQLSRAYNVFHYKLHRKYLTYATHEEALANGGTLVLQPVWEWLCRRWASDDFKKMSTQNKENRSKQKVNHTSGRTSFVVLMERKKDKNLIDFYRDVHWSNKKRRFITPTTEENYNEMVRMMNDKDSEDRNDEAAATIFREVLGHRSGYSRGLGHSVLPDLPKLPGVPNEEYERLAEENAENKKNAKYYQNRLEEIQGGLMAMRDHMREHEERVNMRMSGVEIELESQRETRIIP